MRTRFTRAWTHYTNGATWFRVSTEKVKGKKKLREFYEEGRGGIVKIRYHIDEIIAEGDLVAFRASSTYTTADGRKHGHKFADIVMIKHGKFHRVYTFVEPEKI